MLNNPVYHLFVYGSLRSGFQSPAYEYISRFFTLVGNATTNGKLIDMGSYPAGIPSTDNSEITGELYQIRNENEFPWAIGQLDDYEGVSVEPDEVQLYRRDLTTATCNGREYSAWIYWYNGNVSGRPVVPSGDILEYMSKKI
jgi:gamma-glutamylcyclotransferase (GGCT)/AIG2-like uncharacterized protein YtfP